jgi:hypothetical protein
MLERVSRTFGGVSCGISSTAPSLLYAHPVKLLSTIVLLSIAALASGCSGSPTSEDDGVESASQPLLTDAEFFGRLGVSGSVVTPASAQVFKDLTSRGVDKIRGVTYLSFGRGPQIALATNVVAPTGTTNLDLFVSVFVDECGSSAATGCQELFTIPTDTPANQQALMSAFSAQFLTVVQAVNAKGNIVKTWGVNEPDLAMANLADWPERAALFYVAARQTLVSAGCTGCSVVAGEFADFDGEANFKRYSAMIDSQLAAAGLAPPTVFSLHPYGDVDRATAQNWKYVQATTTDAYVTAVKNSYPSAGIWLTEVGRMLHQVYSVKHTPADEWASGAFVRGRLANHRGVTRVYWYQLAFETQSSGEKCDTADPLIPLCDARHGLTCQVSSGTSGTCQVTTKPTEMWDSALADEHGNFRASYFGLLNERESEALRKAKKDDSNPNPDP